MTFKVSMFLRHAKVGDGGMVSCLVIRSDLSLLFWARKNISCHAEELGAKAWVARFSKIATLDSEFLF